MNILAEITGQRGLTSLTTSGSGAVGPGLTNRGASNRPRAKLISTWPGEITQPMPPLYL